MAWFGVNYPLTGIASAVESVAELKRNGSTNCTAMVACNDALWYHENSRYGITAKLVAPAA